MVQSTSKNRAMISCAGCTALMLCCRVQSLTRWVWHRLLSNWTKRSVLCLMMLKSSQEATQVVELVRMGFHLIMWPTVATTQFRCLPKLSSSMVTTRWLQSARLRTKICLSTARASFVTRVTTGLQSEKCSTCGTTWIPPTLCHLVRSTSVIFS